MGGEVRSEDGAVESEHRKVILSLVMTGTTVVFSVASQLLVLGFSLSLVRFSFRILPNFIAHVVAIC